MKRNICTDKIILATFFSTSPHRPPTFLMLWQHMDEPNGGTRYRAGNLPTDVSQNFVGLERLCHSGCPNVTLGAWRGEVRVRETPWFHACLQQNMMQECTSVTLHPLAAGSDCEVLPISRLKDTRAEGLRGGFGPWQHNRQVNQHLSHYSQEAGSKRFQLRLYLDRQHGLPQPMRGHLF